MRGFQLMQILGLLGVYFDAGVVFVKKTSLLFRLALRIGNSVVVIFVFTVNATDTCKRKYECFFRDDFNPL